MGVGVGDGVEVVVGVGVRVGVGLVGQVGHVDGRQDIVAPPEMYDSVKPKPYASVMSLPNDVTVAVQDCRLPSNQVVSGAVWNCPVTQSRMVEN